MPLNSEIANLMVQAGRDRAAGIAGAGEAWSRAISQIGQQVAQIPQQMEAQKERDDQQRARDARSELSDAMKATALNPDGTINVTAIAQHMTSKGFGPEFAPAADHLDRVNQAISQVNQSRLNLVHQGAAAVAAAGNDPKLAHSFLDTLDGIYPAQKVQEYREFIDADPANTAKLTAYLAGEQKPIILPATPRGGAPAQAINPLTHQTVATGSIAPAPPPTPEQVALDAATLGTPNETPTAAQSAAAVKITQGPTEAARTETNRHNLAMEAIAKMTAGREAAAQAETARHNKAMEAAANPYGALTSGAGQPGGPASPAQAEPPTGDAFLQTLPPNIAAEVKAYAEGKRPFPTGMSMYRLQPLIQMVSQYDPSFDASNFNARNKARTDLTNPGGTGGKTINALNTAIQHAGKLSDLIEALDNTNIPAANAVMNWWNQQTGGTKVTNFKDVQPQLMKEIERAWRGTGGSHAEIEDLKHSLGANAGLQQQREGLQQFVDLMRGKLDTVETQRDNVLGPSGKEIPVLYPQSQPILDKIAQRSSGSAGAAVTTSSPKVGDIKYLPDGTKVQITFIDAKGNATVKRVQ